MIRNFRLTVCLLFLGSSVALAQETSEVPPTLEPPANEAAPAGEGVSERLQGAIETGEKRAKEIAKEVDADPRAKDLTAGILAPIYRLAEVMSHAAFHWVAFAIMVAGVVSFALQLVIGKLVVLTRLHLSVTEILSDALGLVISLVGLVLTTQAATENSTFPDSPASVLSATGAGVLVGLIFYWWGQSQELKAARAAKLATK